MVKYSDPSLDLVYAALANTTRRAMIRRLAKRGSTVTELATPFKMTLNGVSKHIKVLEEAQLVKRTVEGREHRLELNPEPLRTAAGWAAHYSAFWNERLDALEKLFRAKPARRTR